MSAPLPFLAAVVAALLLASVLIATLVQERSARKDRALALARTEALDHARKYAKHASQALSTVEAALADIAENMTGGPAAMGNALLKLHLAVKHKSLYLPQAIDVRVFDAEGRLQANGTSYPPSAMSVAEEPFFRRHRDQWERFVVEKPWKTPSGTWTFGLSRGITENGKFNGVVQALVDPAYFEGFQLANEEEHAAGDPGRLDAVMLFDADGTVLAAWVPKKTEDTIGFPVRSNTAFAGMPIKGFGSSGLQTLDSEGHVVGIIQLSDFSFRVAAALSRAAVLREWSRQVSHTTLIIAVIVLVTITFIALAIRQMRQGNRVKE
ncbi:MAG: hypothetical protein H7840_02805 [Alphaproteobacteria bacterium]